MTPW